MNLEIAERLDVSPNTINGAVWEMRRRGIDVPPSAYFAARREQNARGFGPAHVREHRFPVEPVKV